MDVAEEAVWISSLHFLVDTALAVKPASMTTATTNADPSPSVTSVMPSRQGARSPTAAPPRSHWMIVVFAGKTCIVKSRLFCFCHHPKISERTTTIVNISNNTKTIISAAPVPEVPPPKLLPPKDPEPVSKAPVALTAVAMAPHPQSQQSSARAPALQVSMLL